MISRSLQKPSRQSKWLDFGGSGLLAVWSLMLAVCLLCSCSAKTSSTNAPAPASTNLQTFQVNGVVTKLLSDGKSIEIRHEEVPNFMPAMTMPFEVKNPKELAGLKVNDSVSFRLSVTDS